MICIDNVSLRKITNSIFHINILNKNNNLIIIDILFIIIYYFLNYTK